MGGGGLMVRNNVFSGWEAKKDVEKRGWHEGEEGELVNSRKGQIRA